MPSYYSRLCDRNHLLLAWKRISKVNRFSRGFDEISIEKFSRNLHDYLAEIHNELKNRTFRFTPSLGQLLNKPGGGKRPIKIPAVRDRVVLKAVQLLIEHKFEKFNLDCSFGYVRNRSVSQAVQRIRELARTGFTWVLEGDISKFFDTVNQQKLIKTFIKQVGIRSLVPLMEQALHVEIGNPERFRPEDRLLFPHPDSGIPQGGILSPMLANFYLHPFDKQMTEAGFRLIRYADDFVVMSDSKSSAEKAYELATEILVKQLELKVHPIGTSESKTKITQFSKGFSFLGIRFEGEKVFPSSKAVMKFRERISEICNPQTSQGLLPALSKLRNTMVGWGNAYFAYDVETLFDGLDTHIREKASAYLCFYGFLNPGYLLSKRQFQVLGLPTLRSIRNSRVVSAASKTI